MKTYVVTEQHRKASAESEEVVARDARTAPGEGSFGKLAYEWNNALLLAARRLWDDDAPSLTPGS